MWKQPCEKSVGPNSVLDLNLCRLQIYLMVWKCWPVSLRRVCPYGAENLVDCSRRRMLPSFFLLFFLKHVLMRILEYMLGTIRLIMHRSFSVFKNVAKRKSLKAVKRQWWELEGLEGRKHQLSFRVCQESTPPPIPSGPGWGSGLGAGQTWKILVRIPPSAMKLS